ncbi:uncharacterized protein FA14DRAFT_95261 [Meira miltonrushii]|uniref:Zn(2)-C6 fungal-type domain-containing protein n=1 Tax=Meira miltonrushii TaxID=1280837 RepID=A0A316V4I7_9BASI|nr:uncharacterized protein FA14DRAFT_95261 [Meira miltonrushii]PWN31401.1 hypothetical protein FA14DRAFT_95261 [Meira miltonrushii]
MSFHFFLHLLHIHFNGPISKVTSPLPCMGPERKRKKVHTRSRGGCLTCKERKVKCDEGKPTCQRCTIEGRECQGYVPIGDQIGSQSASQQPYLPSLTAFAPPNPINAVQHPNHMPIDLMSNVQRQIDNDKQISTFDSLLSNMWSDALNADSSIDWNWMNVDPMRTSREFVDNAHFPTMTHPQNRSFGAGESVQVTASPSKHKILGKEDNLQSRLEALCTTQAQWIGLTHFFNHVAQCFHIIPAEANRWRLVFGMLSLQSDVVFRLVVAVGLASVSHHSDTNYRAVEHAHMTYSLRIWHRLVQEEKEERSQGISATNSTSERTLEILAVAVLVGHFEQFDSGLANESNDCLLAALDLIDAILQAQASRMEYGDVDTNVGSSFRFLTRVLLWWETFSRTMGPASGLPFEKLQNIFANVRKWEEDVNESMIDSTQCATGWPLDLLEVVARITKVETEIKSIQCINKHKDCRWFSKRLRFDRSACMVEGDAKHVEYLLSEARAAESQIRSCRPKTIIQDTVAAAELRFILFELLQAGALVYFARVVSGRLEAASTEIQAILRFLHSPAEVQTPSAEPLKGKDGSTPAETEHFSKNGGTAASSSTRDPNTRHGIPEWNNLWAADGHALWAYLQATIAASVDQQAKCRRMIKTFDEIAKCGAIHVFLELVEEIWLRGRQDDTGESITSYRLDEIFRNVIAQRRWKQLLIF